MHFGEQADTSVCQKKTKQSIQLVPDTEDVSLVMKPGNVADSDSAEGPLDRRIVAFLQKSFFEIGAGALHRTKYRREGQETLINIIVVKLLFHIGMFGKIDQFVVSVKEQAVFSKSSVIHGVSE